VVRPTDRQQLVVIPAHRYAGQALAPLSGALEVAHELAREDQVAAREADREVIAHLPRGGGRRRLVQIRHHLGDFTLADAREAIEREGRHLEIQVIQLATQRPRLGATLTGQRRVTRQRERRLAQQQPAALARRPAPLKEPAGAAGPADLGAVSRRAGPVTSGDLDPNTPTAEGREAAQQFPHAQVVEVRNAAHGPELEPSGCVFSIIFGFIRNQRVDDTSCLANIPPVPVT
jgi:pimeloyl-ACP methyl ester carboxylesterase